MPLHVQKSHYLWLHLLKKKLQMHFRKFLLASVFFFFAEYYLIIKTLSVGSFLHWLLSDPWVNTTISVNTLPFPWFLYLPYRNPYLHHSVVPKLQIPSISKVLTCFVLCVLLVIFGQPEYLTCSLKVCLKRHFESLSAVRHFGSQTVCFITSALPLIFSGLV